MTGSAVRLTVAAVSTIVIATVMIVTVIVPVDVMALLGKAPNETATVQKRADARLRKS
jgi:hypothetical protein